MSDLFVRLMRHTNAKEDFFTDCLAETMRLDPRLAERVARVLIRQAMADAEPVQVVSIETQVSFPGSCVDMVLKLADGREFGVENKLWSAEGPGQLARYLGLGFSGVAFITGYLAPVSDEVRDHPLYLKPGPERSHFMWRDFYGEVEASTRSQTATVLNQALLQLMRHLGFEPLSGKAADLFDPDPVVRDENRKSFGRLWEPTMLRLKSREWGWKTVFLYWGANLQMEGGPSGPLRYVYFDLVGSPGNLRVRLNFRSGVDGSRVRERIESASVLLREEMVITETESGRALKRPTVDVLVPMRVLLGDLADSEVISERLSDYTLGILRALSPRT